jgi:predicted dienelactone hydrolase
MVALAGAAALSPTVPLLVVAGDRDGVVPYAPRRDAALAAPAAPDRWRRRFVGLRGAGHLAFSDLCAVGADRGGALGIAADHGVEVPAVLATVSRDGCGGDARAIAATTARLLAATTAFLDETLQCADAAPTWRWLAADPAVELIPAR